MTRQKARGTSKLRTAKRIRQALCTVTPTLQPALVKRDAPKVVTPSAADSPARRNAKLQAVFAFANVTEFPNFDQTDRDLGELVRHHMEEHGPDHEKFGGWTVVKRALEASRAANAKADVVMLRRVLDAAMKLNTPGATATPTIAYIRVSIALDHDKAGRIVVRRGGGLMPDLASLEGAEICRIGRCEICGSYFYARRLLPSGNAPGACPLHTKALRARRYRANHDRYHHRRKIRGAGLQPR